MPRCFIAIGSNIDPEAHVEAALDALVRRFDVVGLSTLYRTPALGPDGRPSGQPDFINGVAAIDTDDAAEDVRAQLRDVEAALGRRRTDDAYAPRTIDLDVILWGDRVAEPPGLRLPDPAIARRPFLHVPLEELAPGLVLPGAGIRLTDLPEPPERDLRPLPALTARLRQRVAAAARRRPPGPRPPGPS